MNFRVPHSAPVIGEEEIDAVARVLRSGRLGAALQRGHVRRNEALEGGLQLVGRRR